MAQLGDLFGRRDLDSSFKHSDDLEPESEHRGPAAASHLHCFACSLQHEPRAFYFEFSRHLMVASFFVIGSELIDKGL